MNSGLVGALGAAPLQTVKARLGSFQGRSHVFFPLSRDSSFVVGREPPDGSINGGNNVGAQSISIVTDRQTAGQTASGSPSIAVGRRATASGNHSIAIGGDAVASGGTAIAIGGEVGSGAATASGGLSIYIGRTGSATGNEAVAIGAAASASGAQSTALGPGAITGRYGTFAWSSNNGFGGGVGGNPQTNMAVMIGVTTDATPFDLNMGRYVSDKFGIGSGRVWSGYIKITAFRSDGVYLNLWNRSVLIKNVSGTTTLVNLESLGTDLLQEPALAISVTANDTNDTLNIRVTGKSGETWRWAAQLFGVDYQIGGT